MIKKVFSKVKESRLLLDNCNSKDIGRKYCVKSFFGSIFLSLLAVSGLGLIFIEILKLYSPVLITYHITLVCVCITVYLFVPFTNMLYYAILKNYTQKEEIQKISLKYIFISELLNPFYLAIAIIFVLVIRYFVG